MKFPCRAALAAITVAGALALGLPQATASAPLHGIDVSGYQHPNGAAINWPAVARAGYRFAFIKDTEGDYYVNPWYASDVRSAEAAGLAIASYHFANPSQSYGFIQARYLVAHGGYQRGEGVPVLDIEKNPYGSNHCYGFSAARMVTWIWNFENTVHNRTGVWPMINTPASWWNTCTGHSTEFGNRLLWVEKNVPSETRPVLPAGWHTWAYWQYSITARVPGIGATTDLDISN